MVSEIGIALPQRRIEAGNRVYMAVQDLVLRDQLVLAGRVIDLVYGEPWRGPFNVRLTSGDTLRVRAASDGFFAVAGDPERAFPGLDVNPSSIDLAVGGNGLRERAVTVPVPVAATFPRPAIEIELARLPITLTGRTVQAVNRNPVPGAWVTFADAALTLLRTPLHAGHAAGAEVRECQLNPAGPLKTLDAPAARGASTLLLSDRQGLAPGDLLRLGAEGRWEVAVVEDLAPLPANPALPGEVTLTAPLARSFAQGAEAQPVAAVDLAGLAALDAEVFAGGGVLPLTAPVAALAVRLEAAAAANVEYHLVGALADADGYYRADGLDRPARADLEATAAGFLPALVTWAADFARPANRIDFGLET